MLDFWDKELDEEEVDALTEKAAAEIHRRGLDTPAILFLEMHKPLANVVGHGALVFAPFLVPILGFDRVNDYSRFFCTRENVERLIARIEALRLEAREAKACNG